VPAFALAPPPGNPFPPLAAETNDKENTMSDLLRSIAKTLVTALV
jgi:hypothetical protein